MSAYSNHPHQGQFRSALLANIKATVQRMKADGTASCSVDCLRQCVKPPGHMPDAPSPQGYPEVFRQVVESDLQLRAFTY